jgi:hypothetical protein
LLTADKALELRQYKEATGKSLLRQGLEGGLGGAAGAIGLGGAAYALTDDPSKIAGAAGSGFAAGVIPKLGAIGLRKYRHGATTRAIKQGLKDEAALAAGVIPDRNKLGTAGRLVGKVAAPYATRSDEPADELDAYFE